MTRTPWLALLLGLSVMMLIACDNAQSSNTTDDTPSTTQDPGLADRTSHPPDDARALGASFGLSTPGRVGGKVVLTTISGPKTLNNVTSQETSTSNVTRQMHRGLVEVSPKTFEVEPALASSWEFSPDNRTVTFHLRQGVKFSDGQPFSADDVVFTFNDLIFNDDVNADVRANLMVSGEPIQVEKVDDHTVKVSMAEPFRPLLRALAAYDASIYPKHLMADKVAKLNPGVRSVMRYIKQTLESNQDTLQAASADLYELLSQTVDLLTPVVDGRDGDKINTAAFALQAAVGKLLEAVDESEEDLRASLKKVQAEVGRLGDYIAQDMWEGVPPGAFNNAWSINTPADEFAGLGPFKFVRYDLNQQVVLERNPYYWKTDANGVQLPYIDQLVYLVVENQDVALLKFKTGESDTFAARPEDWPLLLEGVPTEDCEVGDERILCFHKANNWELIRGGPLFGTTFVSINQDAEDPALRAVFRNTNFRRAFAHALDKQSIIDNIYNGLALPQWSPVSVPSPYYDDTGSFATYPYDIEQAQRMLDELQLVDTDGDGVRNITDQFLSDAGVDVAGLEGDRADEDARELAFLLVTNGGNTLRERMASLITTDLKKAGMNPTFKPMDFNKLVTDLLGAKYETVLIGFTGDIDPNNSANIWTTEGDLHFWRYSAKEDPPAWEARVDELFDQAATTLDEDQAKAYFKEYQELVGEHLPVIYTVNQQFVYAANADLANSENFRAITGNVPPVVAFSEVLWWEDEARRVQTVQVEPQ